MTESELDEKIIELVNQYYWNGELFKDEKNREQKFSQEMKAIFKKYYESTSTSKISNEAN